MTNINRLIVFGSGAVALNGPKAIKPPIFNRYSWNERFKESLIYYNDPTRYLSDEIALGWGVGTEKEYYIETIADIIKKLVENYKIHFNKEIKTKNILFYGSSGGGFTSIILATLIKGSKALVNNSQLIIKNYYDIHVDKLKEVCFSNLDDDEIFNKYGYRLNVLEMFKRENYIPKIKYYVNLKSAPDINRQCIPFIQGLEKLEIEDSKKNEVEIIFYKEESGRGGHHPLSYKKTIKIIKNTSNYNNNYNYFKKTKILRKRLKKYKSRRIMKITDKIINIKNKVLK